MNLENPDSEVMAPDAMVRKASAACMDHPVIVAG
jgi:hypothetical protein